MPLSQHVLFVADNEHNQDTDLFGRTLAERLSQSLALRGWTVSPFLELYYNCWTFFCERNEVTLQLMLAELAIPQHWAVQIAPKYTPGFLGRLLGRIVSALPADIYAASKEIHDILCDWRDVRDIRWRWDMIPDDRNATAVPTHPTEERC